ncbi:MAG: DNA methyltransferase [Cetobacterium sp.]|uniref:DNA methyltransferase n=1 Tax=Cetobacterium sp. TaxID=2071632 RepID=UPI003EE768C7
MEIKTYEIEKILNQNNIYKSLDLKNMIIGLEKKYKIADEKNFFDNLVNFSKNMDTPYHKWFKYREGYSHLLVKELLKRSRLKESSIILDPFCGSGTTIVESKLNGYSSIGIEINPMSAFVANVKANSYSSLEIKEIEEKLNDMKINLEFYEENREIEGLKRYEAIREYFSNRNLEKLIYIKEKIEKIENRKIHDLFFCAYLSIIEEVSDRKRDGNGLRKSTSKIKDVFECYISCVTEMYCDIKENPLSENLDSRIISGNAMNMSSYLDEKDKIDAIIYSPPYANSFDYFESYKMELTLGDFIKEKKELQNYRENAVESFIGKKTKLKESYTFIEEIAQEIESAIPLKEIETGKKDLRTRKVPKMIKGYFNDMAKVLEESHKVLSDEGKCYIVVDQSSYLGKWIPTDLFLAYIAEHKKFKVEEIIVCRSAKTSAQQQKKYPYLKEVLRESIVVLGKNKEK